MREAIKTRWVEAAKSNENLALELDANLATIAQQFASQGNVKSVNPLGNGNINSTFLVTVDLPLKPESPAIHPAIPEATDKKPQERTQERTQERFVLQRINTQVFRRPELVIQNMAVLSEHLRDRSALQGNALQRWETPYILPTRQGEHYWIDESGAYWRAISFIENAYVHETVKSLAHAQEVGYGLAMFHRLISTLPAEKLADTLEGFHITPTYLAAYERVLGNHPPLESSQAEQVRYALSFIEQRKAWANVLEQAKAAGKLKLRPIHGDPKVNNILLGEDGRAVSLIDLDTLKPGLVHYDIGDCLRSGCNRLGEETEDWQQVVFDADLAEAMLRGYLSLAKDFLTEADYDYLYDAIRLIAFELGLRFFTDYLAGNVYFKVKHPAHNLTRSLVQFKLTESIEAQADKLRAMIQSLR
jgi:Ser/Thr protein kinase RdoA (MazF antagonist)